MGLGGDVPQLNDHSAAGFPSDQGSLAYEVFTRRQIETVMWTMLFLIGVRAEHFFANPEMDKKNLEARVYPLSKARVALPSGNWFKALHQTEIPTTDPPLNIIATNGFFDPPELCGVVRWHYVARWKLVKL